jgi:hypothetical protein
MTPEHVKFLLQAYKGNKWPPRQMSEKQLATVSPKMERGDVMSHLHYMAQEATKFVDDGDVERAMRWLGFIQGVAWVKGVSSIDELRRDNRTEDEAMHVTEEHIIQFFTYDHLPAHLQEISKPFALMAAEITTRLPQNPERTVALRKLLESKDAAVRARLAK